MEWPRTALYSRCQAKLNLNVEKKKRCSWRSAGHRCTWDEYCVGYAFALPREEKKERGDKAYRRAGYNDLAKGVQGKPATGVPLAGSSARTCNGGSFPSGRISPIWTRPSGPISCNILLRRFDVISEIKKDANAGFKRAHVSCLPTSTK